MYTLEEIIEKLKQEYELACKSPEDIQKHFGLNYEIAHTFLSGYLRSVINTAIYNLEHLRK